LDLKIRTVYYMELNSDVAPNHLKDKVLVARLEAFRATKFSSFKSFRVLQLYSPTFLQNGKYRALKPYNQLGELYGFKILQT
jgi:hypothetical protein